MQFYPWLGMIIGFFNLLFTCSSAQSQQQIDYLLNNNTSQAVSEATLFIVSAPSGAGKTSLVKALQEVIENITVSVSHTTRKPRPGEVDGSDYHFVSVEEFKRIQASQGFLESAQVFDRYYGTARATVEESLAQGIDVILEIDWQGAQQVREQFQDSVSIFILPPSLEILEQRLRQRAQDNEETIARRMQDALSEISHHTEYDFLILNDEFDDTLESFKSIILSSRQTNRRQIILHRQIINNLLAGKQ